MYYSKSCDVKLIRRLIYDNAKTSPIVPLEDWAPFDFITELIDDIEDLQEDLITYNTNRIIFDIAGLGLDKTINVYLRFIDEMQQEFNDLSEKSQQYMRQRFHHCCTQLREQLKALRSADDIVKQVSNAAVFNQFNQQV